MKSSLLDLIDTMLIGLSQDVAIIDKEAFQKLQNSIYRGKGITAPIPNIALIERYRDLIARKKLEYSPRVWKILRRRAVRSLSGVAVISFLTKSFGCPGKCTYCPTYEGLPKSYVSDEPAVMRAQMNDFDIPKQILNRLRALEITGHVIDKCDVRTIGGTWSFYPKAYQESVIRSIYDAHSNYLEFRSSIIGNFLEQGKFSPLVVQPQGELPVSLTLEAAQIRNETAICRVIGLAIETRPDWINLDEIVRLRSYGVTRVEIGYQTTHDAINEGTQRGHGNKESIRATKLLKDAGCKVVAHMMPNLPGSTIEMDISAIQRIYNDPDFCPDEIKIYPCMVTPHSQLEKQWRDGGYEPYSDEILIDLMAHLQSLLPEYTRLNRMYRDIPSSEILAGSTLANLRQHTEDAMKQQKLQAHDISHREIRSKGNNPATAVVDITEYLASEGKEYFIQYIDPIDRTLFAIGRLRIPSWYYTGIFEAPEELRNCAIIRELHVFGDPLPIGSVADGSGQHMGFGKKMLQVAEDIVRETYPTITHMAVISGIGAREYYRKRGYMREGSYMKKLLQA